MRKSVVLLILWVLSVPLSGHAAPVQVGKKAPDFKLKDVTGRPFSLIAASWKGKLLLFMAMPVKEAKTNTAVSETLTKESGIDRTKLAGAAIFDTPSPEALTVLKERQKETGKIYLIDPDGSFNKLWGLKSGAPNVILLDKGRICRYLYSGKLPGTEITKLIQAIKKYQTL